MSTVSAIELPTQVASLRSQLAALQATATSTQAEIRQLERAAAAAAHRPQELSVIEARLAHARAQLTSTEQQISEITNQLATLGYPVEPAGAQIESLSTQVPLALLPVRLETRWVKVVSSIGPQPEEPNLGAKPVRPSPEPPPVPRPPRPPIIITQLLIRIFPDQIHSDTHEPPLTANELAYGQNFWTMYWCAGGEAPQQAEAWRQLAQRFGPARAAWIARTLRPQNPTDAPSAPCNPSALNPKPEPPAVDSRDSSWTRGAIARLLPERFLAIGYSGTARACAAWGEPVTPDLVTGPGGQGGLTTVSGLTVEVDTQWLYDFEVACQVGMGIRMTIPAGIDHLDQLIVLGARPSETATQGASGLGQLLTAHTYTDGFELLPPGAATNNTADTRSALAAPSDPPAPVQWLTPDPVTPATGTDGQLLSSTLGIDPTTLADITGADGQHAETARAMIQALWPATGGYYLRQLQEGAVTDTEQQTVETWALENVRPGGHLPVIRIGTQPYGVLPACSLDTWTVGTGGVTPATFKKLLTAKDTWLKSSQGVPRAGGPAGAVGELLGVLSMDALSSTYAARPFFGPEYIDALFAAGLCTDPNPQRQAALIELAEDLQAGDAPAGQGPRLVRGLFATESKLLTVPLLDREGALDRPVPANLNYLLWLLETTPEAILAESGVASRPAPGGVRRTSGESYPLLFYLLRASVLIEAARAALPLITPNFPSWLIDVEIVNPHGLVSVTATTVLAAKVGSPPRSAGDLVWGPHASHASARINALRQAIQHLAGVPAGELDVLARQTIDLCSHRLDPWVTSLAWQRISAQRPATAPSQGLNVGAYGWLESLAPAGGSPDFQSSAPVTPQGSAGWIHAPSLPQATTAAILRAGERAHAGQAEGRLLELDLSSNRARQAAWLLDGVRAGNSLGALLGYQFERVLQESSDPPLAALIPFFRTAFPAVAGKLLATGGDRPQNAPCVDGLALVGASNNTIQDVLSSASAEADSAAVDALISKLSALADAVSDAVTAETVHHAALGNPIRSAASLEAIDRGEAPPPELDFIRSPQAAVAVSHRVCVLREASADPTGGVAGWPSVALLPPRAVAEPVLSAITAGLLPAPTAVRYTIVRPGHRGPGGGVSGAVSATLADLGVGPLDVLYGTAGANGVNGSELEQRIQAHALALRRGNVTAHVVFARQPGWSEDDVSVPELAELCATLRDTFASARPVNPTDLIPTEATTSTEVDGSALQERASNALNAFNGLVQALTTGIASSSGEDQVLLGLLEPLSYYGLSEAILATAGSTVTEQAQRVAAVAQDRSNAAGAALSTSSTDAAKLATLAMEALNSLFGSGFTVLPPFLPDPSSAPDLSQTSAITGGSPQAAEDFLAEAMGVQRNLERWQDARLLSGALQPLGSRNAGMALVVAQLPAPDIASGELWAGLPGEIIGGRTSWILDTPLASLNDEVAGLLVDQWVDVVPQALQSTGIAFNFAAPASQPPQAILLAVPPDQRQTWTVEAIERVIVETLELAHARAVDLDTLETVGHIFPALFLAVNENGGTISTDLIPPASLH